MEIIGRRKAKEVILVKVNPEECILEKIEGAMKEIGGNAIVVSAVGTLSCAVLVNPVTLDKERHRLEKRELDGPLEIVSLVGAVGPAHAHGDRMSHIHISLAKYDMPNSGGILRYGSKAWHPVEVYLLAYE